MIDAAECKRQAVLLENAAPGEPDIAIRTALLSMVDGWLALEKQMEWVAEMRARLPTTQLLKNCDDAQTNQVLR